MNKFFITFKIPHKSYYYKVALAGTFNNWNQNVHYLKKINSDWIITIELEPGYYEYKFVINDNIWINDAQNIRTNVLDQNNSIILIDENGLSIFNKEFNENYFPQIIYPDEKYKKLYNELYHQLFSKISYGNTKNNFSKIYFNEGKDDCIYQWDCCFSELFLMFGNNVFPLMANIDNFYRVQSADGYIPRLLRVIDGLPTAEYKKSAPLINPPIFSYIEWKYLYFTGNIERIKNIFEKIEKYYFWIEENLSIEYNNRLFYNTLLGSGMDNLQREHLNKKSVWIDMSSQQALSSLILYKLCKLLNYYEKEKLFLQRYNEIKNEINKYCWDNETNYYYDVKEDGSKLKLKTAAGFWPYLASLATPEQIDLFILHLLDPTKFYRKNVVPALSADEEGYSSMGWQWRGGVWSQINYILFEGLKNYNYFYIPYILTKRNLSNIQKVFYEFEPEQDKISPLEKNVYTNTFWEFYAPDFEKPAYRWDNNYYCKANYLNWTALSVINMFIENILGFDFNGLNNLINLRIFEIDENYRGIDRFYFRGKPLKIIYKLDKDKIILEYSCEEEINLCVNYKGKVFNQFICGNNKVIELKI
ncbi:MAG TPA: trehalase family glycosidase [bacterium]|nr:trehalase family glycosidase [bacterium]HOL47378.1 trehalase family glycosidase [bacterium]HPQ18123.1 trehalase family glycosidase [bacterium]